MTPSEIRPGMKFGHWTVIKYSHTNKHRIKYFLCRCDCGIERAIRGTSLIQGTSVACSRRCADSLIGQKFGRLTVINFDRSKPGYYWCECECGNKESIRGSYLKNHQKRQCFACSGHKEHLGVNVAKAQRYKQYIGQKFDRLLVKDVDMENRSFICVCDCGKEVMVRYYNLLSGNTTSCGCKRQDSIRKGIKNVYEQYVGQKINMLTIESCFYKNNSFWFDCVCDCGKKTTVQATKLISGYIQSCGCLKSKAEEDMEQILISHGIKYKREYKINDCRDKQPLPFDFAIFNDADELVGLIELNGKQHYSEGGWNTKQHLEYVQKHDKIKHRFCLQNDIPFLVIPYQYFKELEKFLITSDFWSFITENFND